MQAQRAKIQQLLGAEHSPLRDQLLRLGFEALAAQPLAQLTSSAASAELIVQALTRENVSRTAQRHVLPGAQRVVIGLAERDERVRDALTPAAEQILRELVAAGHRPRLTWLRGAFDAEDFRQLLAPVVQQVLLQFTSKLPLVGAAAGSSAVGGWVGMLGKQVQKSAGQLADVGRSVMSGLGSEFERRMQAVARDFSDTATGELRSALIERLRSDEGKRILTRMRERVIEHVLSARLADIVADVPELPLTQYAELSAELLAKLAQEAWARAFLTQSIAGVLDELGERSLAELLEEAGLRETAQAQITAAVEPGLRQLVGSEPFGTWLDHLLEESVKP